VQHDKLVQVHFVGWQFDLPQGCQPALEYVPYYAGYSIYDLVEIANRPQEFVQQSCENNTRDP
jgi:hypothetical protein